MWDIIHKGGNQLCIYNSSDQTLYDVDFSLTGNYIAGKYPDSSPWSHHCDEVKPVAGVIETFTPTFGGGGGGVKIMWATKPGGLRQEMILELP